MLEYRLAGTGGKGEPSVSKLQIQQESHFNDAIKYQGPSKSGHGTGSGARARGRGPGAQCRPLGGERSAPGPRTRSSRACIQAVHPAASSDTPRCGLWKAWATSCTEPSPPARPPAPDPRAPPSAPRSCHHGVLIRTALLRERPQGERARGCPQLRPTSVDP